MWGSGILEGTPHGIFALVPLPQKIEKGTCQSRLILLEQMKCCSVAPHLHLFLVQLLGPFSLQELLLPMPPLSHCLKHL